MSLTKTSIAALATIGFAAAAASASACDFHAQQVQANASTPATEQQQAETAATPIDPVILAKIEARDETTEPVEQK